MSRLAKELVSLHGKEGLRADQWFDLMLDDVLAGFGIKLESIPEEPVNEVLFNLSGLYAQEVIKAVEFTDLLGPVHMELVSKYHQKGSGQFFTPESVCKFLVQMTLQGFSINEDQDRLITMSDPAVGSGGILLAALDHIASTQGPESLAWVSITGIDLDRRCSRMFPVQVLSNLFVNRLSLGELVSYHGNALGDPNQLNTVCHYTRAGLPEVPPPADHPEVKKAVVEAIHKPCVESSQLTLF